MRTIVLSPGDQSQCAGEHVGGKKFHAPLDDGRMWWNRGSHRSWRSIGFWCCREHGDGEERRPG